jgi:uncharacterized membrane protein YgaE (UPF0421/DUF939 family)
MSLISIPPATRWQPDWRDLRERARIGWPLAVRMIVSAVVALAISKALHLPEVTWSVLTALVTARSHATGTARAGADRAVGTIGGAVIGVAAAFLHGHFDPLIVLLLVLAPACMLVAIDEKFRAAPVAGLIVISGGAGAGGPLITALHRTTEILIGAVVAYVASLVIAPKHGNQKIEYHAAAVVDLLRRQCVATLRPKESEASDTLRDKIRDELRAMAVTSHFTRWSRSQSTDSIKLTRLLSAVHADLNFLARLMPSPPLDKVVAANTGAIERIAIELEAVIAGIADVLRKGTALPSTLRVDEAIATLERAAPGHLTFLLRVLRNDVARTSGLIAAGKKAAAT